MTKISIFDLEKRFDWEEEVRRLSSLIYDDKRIDTIYSTCSFSEVIDDSIIYFPMAQSARNAEEYFEDLNYETSDRKTTQLRYIHFYTIYLEWYLANHSLLIRKIKNYANEVSLKDYGEIYFRNLSSFLEGANYKWISGSYDEKLKIYQSLFVKRDHDVDSILNIVEADIRLRLLTYLDFRNEKNLEFKIETMRILYIDIEKDKNSFKKLNENLFKETKFALNKTRHPDEYFQNLTNEEKMDFCDKAFDCYIHLIRESTIKEHIMYFKDFRRQ